jgi:hypothetical protein
MKPLVFGWISAVYVPWLKDWWNCKDNTKFETCTGYIKDAVQLIGEFMGRNVSVKAPTRLPGRGGAYLPNGTWTGVVADVIV